MDLNIVKPANLKGTSNQILIPEDKIYHVDKQITQLYSFNPLLVSNYDKHGNTVRNHSYIVKADLDVNYNSTLILYTPISSLDDIGYNSLGCFEFKGWDNIAKRIRQKLANMVYNGQFSA